MWWYIYSSNVKQLWYKKREREVFFTPIYKLNVASVCALLHLLAWLSTYLFSVCVCLSCFCLNLHTTPPERHTRGEKVVKIEILYKYLRQTRKIFVYNNHLFAHQANASRINDDDDDGLLENETWHEYPWIKSGLFVLSITELSSTRREEIDWATHTEEHIDTDDDRAIWPSPKYFNCQ